MEQLKKPRSTKAKNPETDKRKQTWKNNLSKAHKVQQEMKQLRQNQVQYEIYDDDDDNSTSGSDSSSEEPEYIIKPKRQPAKKKNTKSKDDDLKEEIKNMKMMMQQMANENKKLRKKQTGGKKPQTVVQVVQPQTQQPNGLYELKQKTLLNI